MADSHPAAPIPFLVIGFILILIAVSSVYFLFDFGRRAPHSDIPLALSPVRDLGEVLPPEESNISPLPLLRVRSVGGLCPPDPRLLICGYEIMFGRDGSYIYTADIRVLQGKIDKQKAQDIAALMEGTDFTALRARKFTGICPTAHDGAEVTYSFYTAVALEVLERCEVQIDTALPLFQAIDEISRLIISSR